MNNQKLNYGNWISKKIMGVFLIITIILLVISILFFPLYTNGPFWFLIVKVILRIASGVILVITLYLIYVNYQFSKNDNLLRHKLWDIVINKLSWYGQGKALDIGTGNGVLAIKLANKYPRAKIIGVDYWGKSWDHSKKICEKNAFIEKVDDRIIFQKVTAAHLPFNDEEFDAVVSNFVFHEVRDIKNKREVILEAFRVIRKGGFFSFQDIFSWKTIYGDLRELLDTIRGWGIENVQFANSCDLVKIPKLLRIPLMLGKSGIIYGKK